VKAMTTFLSCCVFRVTALKIKKFVTVENVFLIYRMIHTPANAKQITLVRIVKVSIQSVQKKLNPFN